MRTIDVLTTEPQPGTCGAVLKVLSSGQDNEADLKRRLGADADTPQRIKYRTLTR